MVLYKFSIPLVPITKKNSQRILKRANGQPFIAPSHQYKAYEEMALWYVPKRGVPINEAVNIKCSFYMPTKRPCDLTNHLESIDDILVKAGLLKDDNYTVVASHDGSRVMVDKDNPRTEVVISKIEEGENVEGVEAQR